MRLTNTLAAWGTDGFEAALKQELKGHGAELPLQGGLRTGSYAVHDKIDVLIQRVTEGPQVIQVKVGIFFSGIIAGCNCSDDPTPVEESPEYCELELDIDRGTAETRARLLGG